MLDCGKWDTYIQIDVFFFYLVRIAFKNRLLLEFELARVVPITSYIHCSMVFTIYITKD